LGGDEVNTACYEKNANISSYLRETGITVHQLITNYMQKLYDSVQGDGKRIITWEDMLLSHKFPMDPDNTLVQAWRGASSVRKIVSLGRRVIASPASHWYLDCGQGAWMNTAHGGNSWCDPYKTWQHMYTYDPLTDLEDTGNTDASHPQVVGGEVTMWTEKTDPLNLDVKIWPRAAAVAEVLWSGRRDIHGHERTTRAAHPRIHRLRRRLAAFGLRPDVVNMLWCETHMGSCEVV
jgi:hexosaminidase